MKKIKFSHWYWKLDNVYKNRQMINRARLLQAFKIHYKDLSEPMIKYDATFGNNEIYPLPKTELIFLVFVANQIGGGVFTTIRRYTPKKFEYYQRAIGELFEVNIN